MPRPFSRVVSRGGGGGGCRGEGDGARGYFHTVYALAEIVATKLKLYNQKEN